MSAQKIKQGKVVLLLVPNKDYSMKLINFIKKLPKKQSICYVTANKSYDALLSQLKLKKVDTNNFFFIDCVTKTIIEPKQAPKNVVFISSPNDLTSISLAIGSAVKKNTALIIVDSLSTLAVYHPENVLVQFSYDIISKVRQNSSVGLILSIAEEDRKNDFSRKIEMKADEVVRLK